KRLKGPVCPSFGGDCLRIADFALANARVGRANLDPGFQVGDLLGRKLFAFGRHLEIFVGVADSFDEQAFIGIAGDDRGAGVAAFQEMLAGLEQEGAFVFLGFWAVTLVTILDMVGPYFFLKYYNACMI